MPEKMSDEQFEQYGSTPPWDEWIQPGQAHLYRRGRDYANETKTFINQYRVAAWRQGYRIEAKPSADGDSVAIRTTPRTDQTAPTAAKRILQLLADGTGRTPGQISVATGLPGGTTRRAVSDLHRSGEVYQHHGLYYAGGDR